MSEMIYKKTSTGASPLFDHGVKTNVPIYGQNPGAVNSDGANHGAGGYVPPERFINHRNSSGVTNHIGGDTPPKGRGV
jgi:hypothetical protein